MLDEYSILNNLRLKQMLCIAMVHNDKPIEKAMRNMEVIPYNEIVCEIQNRVITEHIKKIAIELNVDFNDYMHDLNTLDFYDEL